MLEIYRQQRINEMKLERLANRFGELAEIKKADWIPEVIAYEKIQCYNWGIWLTASFWDKVTESSQRCSVVVHLYSDSLVECDLMNEVLTALAKKFPYVKYLKIKSNQAVENWPDRNLPTLFVYKDGELKFQALTLNEFGGTNMTTDGEFLLVNAV